MNLVIRFMPAVLDPRRFLPFPGRKARIGFRGGGPGAVDSTYRFFVPMGWVDDVGVSFGLGALFRWLLLFILLFILFFSETHMVICFMFLFLYVPIPRF
jgi:hypothetical protein